MTTARIGNLLLILGLVVFVGAMVWWWAVAGLLPECIYTLGKCGVASSRGYTPWLFWAGVALIIVGELVRAAASPRGLFLGVSDDIDTLNTFLGRAVAYFILASILISAVNATIRKLFSISSNWALELQWHLFGAAILIGASWTLLRNEHVRIDIFINQLPPRWRNIIDLVGHFVVLMPFTLLGMYETLPWVETSYKQQEYSSNFGGLILWPVKASILLGFFLLFLQGISEIIKRVATLRGLIPDPHARGPEPHGGDAMIEGAV